MPYLRRTFSLALVLLVSVGLAAKSKESSITHQMEQLPKVSTAARPAAIVQIASDIRTLPAGLLKVSIGPGHSA